MRLLCLMKGNNTEYSHKLTNNKFAYYVTRLFHPMIVTRIIRRRNAEFDDWPINFSTDFSSTVLDTSSC